VWSADGKGEPVVLRGHDAAVRYAAFSPDGQRVVTASEDGTARVWSADGKGEPVVLRGHEDWLTSASFSPDGSRVVTTSMDHTARVHEADGSGQPVVLSGHGATVVHAAFDPAGERVVTASEDGTARVFRADGKGESIVLGAQAEPVVRAAWSRDGKRVVLVSVGGLLRVWNADGSGQPILLVTELMPFSISFVDDDQAILIVAANGQAHRWMIDVETLKKRLAEDNADCVAPWARVLMLGESTTDADYTYQRCESRYGRMPAPTGTPPQGQTIAPSVLAQAGAVSTGGPGGARLLAPPEPLLKDAGPAARRVKVVVLPSSAHVTVDGVAARRRAGVVEIESKVGAVHRLRATKAGVHVEQEVTVGDRSASPEVIDLRPRIAGRAPRHGAASASDRAPGFDPMSFADPAAPHDVQQLMPTGISP
jgi:dipeptidyl aminopeptidase/acylaminoacyl peptidase